MKLKFYIRPVMVFTLLMLFTFVLNAQNIYLEIPIAMGADDVEEVVLPNDEGEILGEVDNGSSDLEMPYDHSGQIVGLLFRNVEIEPGQTIVSAYIQFTSDDSDQTADVSIFIQAELSAQPDTIDVEEYDNVSDRTRTAAKIQWDPDPWLAEFDTKPAQATPDLKAILDELTSQDGWVSGNRMLFMFFNPVSEDEVIRKAISYDGGAESGYEAVLHVELAPGSGVENLNNEFVSLVYPNPTEGILYVENISTDKFSYEVFNISGKLVASRQDIVDAKTEINLSTLTKGVYFINLISDKKRRTHKIVLK